MTAWLGMVRYMYISTQGSEAERSYQDHPGLHSRLCLNYLSLKRYFGFQIFLVGNYPEEPFLCEHEENTYINKSYSSIYQERKEELGR